MNFEPQEFFIGLMGFFSIPLPGALLTYRLMSERRKWGQAGLHDVKRGEVE